MNNLVLKKVVHVALFTAFIYVLGLVPRLTLAFIPVPIVLQNLGVFLAGAVLGVWGALSVLLFLVLAFVGLPVLQGGLGGAAIFAGPTGGYLIGYVIAAFIIGVLVQRNWSKLTFIRMFVYTLMGMCAIYAVGIPVLMIVTEMSLESALVSNVVFLPFDIVKVLISSSTGMQFKKYYPLIHTSSVVDATS